MGKTSQELVNNLHALILLQFFIVCWLVRRFILVCMFFHKNSNNFNDLQYEILRSLTVGDEFEGDAQKVVKTERSHDSKYSIRQNLQFKAILKRHWLWKNSDIVYKPSWQMQIFFPFGIKVIPELDTGQSKKFGLFGWVRFDGFGSCHWINGLHVFALICESLFMFYEKLESEVDKWPENRTRTKTDRKHKQKYRRPV